MKNILYTIVIAAILLYNINLKANDVLPGDCNNNGQVELVDFLFWGLASGNTGDARTNATTDCTNENAADWNIEINGVNGKHQDTDGNGIVDFNDLNIVAGNYGCSTGNTNAPLLNRDNAVFSIEEYTAIIDGETAHIFEIYINDVEEINGLAFSFDYGSMSYGINENAIKVDTTGTWLKASELVVMHDMAKDKMDIAFAGSQPVLPPQNEPACKIIIIEDFIGGKPLSLNINIINGVSLNSKGKATSFENANYVKDNLNPNANNALENSHLILSNHINSSENLHIELNNSQEEQKSNLIVSTIGGELIIKNSVLLQAGKNNLQVSTNYLASGIYILNLMSDNRQFYTEKFVIQ